jgi:hypothetical protein
MFLLQALLKGAGVYGDAAAVKGLVDGKGESNSSSSSSSNQVQQ